MVNYLYDLSRIEENHEAFANQSEIVASSAVRRLLKTGARGRLTNVVAGR
jgi:malonyl-CoA decarboxylase